VESKTPKFFDKLNKTKIIGTCGAHINMWETPTLFEKHIRHFLPKVHMEAHVRLLLWLGGG